LIFALTWEVYRLRTVAALLQFGDELLPAPSTVKSPMHQQKLCHEYPPCLAGGEHAGFLYGTQSH
jgi:hypothetical protein